MRYIVVCLNRTKFWLFEFRICLRFGTSDLGFNPRFIDMQLFKPPYIINCIPLTPYDKLIQEDKRLENPGH